MLSRAIAVARVFRPRAFPQRSRIPSMKTRRSSHGVYRYIPNLVMRQRLLRDPAPRFGQLRDVDHQRAALRARGHADGIASARFPDGRDVNGGGAVAAHDVRTILAISSGAANQGGVG